MKATQNQLKETIFPKGDLASADYFTGKVWAEIQPEVKHWLEPVTDEQYNGFK